jgi:hypothetical protein
MNPQTMPGYPVQVEGQLGHGNELTLAGQYIRHEIQSYL